GVARSGGRIHDGIPAILPVDFENVGHFKQPDRHADADDGSGYDMISWLNSSSQSFLTGVDQIQQRLNTAQTQLTTGLKINNVSDAPNQVANLWQTRSDIDQVDQVTSN